ncbi:hypothetical protein EV384_4631 [Micromonospora kangleipakensis]|uniref:SMODS-associated and fused to various effectors domain-containing protein n=1 Tax=Micromonospora kangleipakensis TaxID=1077942 RepID=A0A4Q8BDQ0_9ACTN|nr:hypothetical protein [Micromonospora kangleipakensis]RZU76034.1 hypothetical protein EV384_4631 [Micromonospora kangleipakensis]
MRQARDAMRGAGLRTDEESVIRGRDIVRDWVKTGAGPRTRDAILRHVADEDLLARQGTLVFAVRAIDQAAHSFQPALTVDFFHLYDGDRDRRRLRNPDDWQKVVAPSLAQAVRDLEAFGVRRVHVIGAMRLPLWFAIGVRLPDTRGWACPSTNAPSSGAPIRPRPTLTHVSSVASASTKGLTSPSLSRSPTTPPPT